MKRLLSLILVLALVATTAGCTKVPPAASDAEGKEEEPVTLQWYINYNWYNTPWGGNTVSEAITARTGVNIQFVSPEGNETVNLDALIAGDKLPDLVTLGWWEPQVNEMIAAGQVYALNELADEYDAYFWEVADPERLKWYTQSDGNVYCYPNSSYSPSDYDGDLQVTSNQTFLVRKDIYEAIGSPDMTTPEGFADAVRAAAKQFPLVDGKPLIPVGAHEFTDRGCDSFDKFLQNFLAIPYEKDGEFYDRCTDPEYKRWLQMFRELGEEGLLSNDIFIDKRVQMEEKIADGRYFCMIYQRTDMAEQQRILYEKNPDSIYIAVDGPKNAARDMHTLPSSGLNGWTITLISKNCRNPEKAIRFLSFLMSEEGQKLIALGIEGENYRMENGRAVLMEETQQLMLTDYAEYVRQVGANDTYWMLQDNRMQSGWMPQDDEMLRQMEEWTYPYVCYTGQYDVIFASDSEAGIAQKEIEAIHGQMLPRLLLAPTEEEFERLWEEYIARRKESGLDMVLQESTRQMQAAKEKLGME
ncbi:MAG: extracellular solute-binding protein [Lachnospiraceae bacterium]|nr:extracellular solute-binding protein [Lachnospiraceae bacterium]